MTPNQTAPEGAVVELPPLPNKYMAMWDDAAAYIEVLIEKGHDAESIEEHVLSEWPALREAFYQDEWPGLRGHALPQMIADALLEATGVVS